jgi:hypothetical protein
MPYKTILNNEHIFHYSTKRMRPSWYLVIIFIISQTFTSVHAGEILNLEGTINSKWKTESVAEVRYSNNSTASSFVWLFLVDRKSGEKIEVVSENNMAMTTIGYDIGLDETGEGLVKKWVKFVKENEGREVGVSPAVYKDFLHRNITGIRVPNDLFGAEKLTQRQFIARYFKKASWGDTVPRRYTVPSREALIFIKFCIHQNLNVKRGCETGKLYLDPKQVEGVEFEKSEK